MLSGLYGDLPEAKNNAAAQSGSEGGGWAAKPKFAPPNRKPSTFGAPRSVLGAAKKTYRDSNGKPPVDPTRRSSSAGSSGSLNVGGSGLLGSARTEERFDDEYDPAKPNEYEAVRKDKERVREEAQQEADRQEELRLLQEADRLANAQPALSGEERQAALSLSGEEAFLRRGRLGRGGASSGDANAAEGTFAQRMMEKMGWKEGLGLGRTHQGITTPLEHQKTDKRSGIIKAAEQIARLAEEGIDVPPDKKARGVSFQGTPSRVILLRNIVGPGEVDDTLDDEIGQECSKYGQVTQITIFEVTEPGYNPEEAVRIFVEFQRMESATKALIDLEGRFFGGRNVKAMFFPEERFQKQDLAPRPGQPD